MKQLLPKLLNRSYSLLFILSFLLSTLGWGQNFDFNSNNTNTISSGSYTCGSSTISDVFTATGDWWVSICPAANEVAYINLTNLVLNNNGGTNSDDRLYVYSGTGTGGAIIQQFGPDATGGAPAVITGLGPGQCITIRFDCNDNTPNPSFSATIGCLPAANAGSDQSPGNCSTSTTLSANSVSPALGTWTVSPAAGVSFSNVNDPNATVTGMTAGTPYTFTWTSSQGGASHADQMIFNSAGPGCQTYCNPSYTVNASYGQIYNVTFNTINNTTAGSTVGHLNNYPGSSTAVVQGQTYTLTVNGNAQAGFFGPTSTCATAFFDWNGDGDFLDDSETVDLGSFTSYTASNLSLPITVPCDAAVGTVMVRIVLGGNCPSPSCPTGGGQTESYAMNISAAPVPIANAGSDQILNCVTSTTLNATASTPSPSGFWTLVSGSGSITSPSNPSSTVTGLAAGTSVFQWTQIGLCLSVSDQISITANGIPIAPVNAGVDIASCQASINLNASDPAPGSGQWLVSGPSALTFTPSNTVANPTISGMVNGNYTLTWEVTVSGCPPYTDALTLQYGSLPTPNAGPDQTGICPTSAQLAGVGYQGLTGTWSIVSGPGTPGFVDDNQGNTVVYGLQYNAGSPQYTLQWCLAGGGCPGSVCDNVVIGMSNCVTTVLHSTTTNQTFTGCSYNYYDNGGPGGSTSQNAAGNYSNNIPQTWTTFCPDDPNDYATLTFSAASFYPGDYLVVYDSDGPGAPIVAAYYYDDVAAGGTGMVYSPALNTTITSSTGCLYVQVNTTATNNYPGWAASVGCSSTAGTQSTTFINTNNCGGGGGITLCQSGDVDVDANQSANPSDLGLANHGCLLTDEEVSNTWVYMQAETTGWIAFDISPAGGQDFDYAIWGPYPGGFACPGMTLDDPIRCTFAVNGGASCDANIGIGIINTSGNAVLPTDVSEGGFCATATNEGWTYPLWANAGDVYVLLFQNFDDNNSSFAFNVNDDNSLIPGGETFATLGCDPVQPLSIQLISFIGEKVDRVNKLFWNCASEFENDFFTIEKSSDGLNWSVLSIVDGAGSSDVLTHYSTTDEYPLMGVNYYRLVQTDFDGTRRSYKTIAINNDIEIISDYTDLYPNPTSNSFYFNYGGSNFHSEIAVNVYNAAGQLMSTSTFSEFNASQSMEVETSSLPDGFYHVELIQDGKREVKKLTVIH